MPAAAAWVAEAAAAGKTSCALGIQQLQGLLRHFLGGDRFQTGIVTVTGRVAVIERRQAGGAIHLTVHIDRLWAQ